MIDSFPIGLIDHLNSLPLEADRDDRPSKKPRLDIPAVEPLVIGRGDLTVSRKQPDAEDANLDNFSRFNVGEYLTVSLFPESRYPKDVVFLGLASRPRSPAGFLDAGLALSSSSIGPQVTTIIRAAGNNGLKRCQEAGFSSVINIIVSRCDDVLDIHFSFELHWQPRSQYHDQLGHQSYQLIRNVINTFFPPDGESSTDSEEWSPLDFYEAAYVPSKDDPISDSITIPGMTSTLYPFQRRTLQWLLRREGIEWIKTGDDASGIVQEIDEESPGCLPLSFREVHDLKGTPCYLSKVFHLISTDLAQFRASEQLLKGGILAEEMGLGKTLETIGLILLHPRPEGGPEPNFLDPNNVSPINATLIVTPASLRRQWMDELSRHAPHLRVMHYSGCKTKTREEEVDLICELSEQDIVITTYSVLATELNYVLEPPARAMRHERKYYRTKSPLMQLLWWRVCLDEAQMIESGVSRAAEVAKLIPRVNAWGITGTPVKNAVQDLRGLLIFLRYEPFNFLTESWKDLTTRYKPIFRQLFNTLALRHTKAMVRDEIRLPRQNRYVITMPFAAVEEQHYQSMFKKMIEECHLDTQGTPLVPEWKSEDYHEKMSSWLNRLRQAALHPEVLIRRLYGGTKNRPMRTVDEVLDAMIEQNEKTILSEQRSYLMSMLTRGQLLENGPRVKEALAIWEKVRDEIGLMVDEAQKKLDNAVREATNGRVSVDGADGYELENESYRYDIPASVPLTLSRNYPLTSLQPGASEQHIRAAAEITIGPRGPAPSSLLLR